MLFSSDVCSPEQSPQGYLSNTVLTYLFRKFDQETCLHSLQLKPVYRGGEDRSVNSLVPGKFEWNFRHVIFKQILVIDGWGICCDFALICMSLDFIDDQSILVQVMAWCRQATSHYLSQCWLRSLSPSGVTRPQCVNSLWPSDAMLWRTARSTLIPVMTAPRRDLTQCSLTISDFFFPFTRWQFQMKCSRYLSLVWAWKLYI